MASSIARFFQKLVEQPSLDDLDLAASRGTVAWHTNSKCDYPKGPLHDAWWEGWNTEKTKAWGPAITAYPVEQNASIK